eukprot:tig00000605_g2508.t1
MAPAPVPTPRALPTALRPENHGACDFGASALFAYGCGAAVVVVEPRSGQVLQTLDEHGAAVTAVRWAPEGPLQVVGEPASCARLAAGDAAGAVVVWDALGGRPLQRFQDSSLLRCSVSDLAWHPEDGSLLLSLHAPGTVSLWSTRGRCRVARHDAGERLAAAAFSPFDPAQLCLAAPRGWVGFLSFDPAAAASAGSQPAPRLGFEVGPKYQVSSPPAGAAGGAAEASDLQAVAYVPFARDLIYLVLSRELAVFDSALGQVVCSTPLDRKCSPFAYVLPCRHREDLLLSVHRDGSLGVWTARGGEPGSANALCYDLLHSGELIKQYRRGGTALAGARNCALEETAVACVSSDGRVWLWDVDAAAALRGARRGARLSLAALCEAAPARATAVDALPGAGALALGLASGELLVLEPGTLALRHRVALGKEPIRGVAWVDPCTLVAFGHEELQRATGGEKDHRERERDREREKGGGGGAAPPPPPRRMFKNFCVLVDLRTGHAGELRAEAAAGASLQAGISRGRGAGGGEESSDLYRVRPSPSGPFLAVLPRDKPLELWDLRGPRLARAFGQHGPATALAWLAPDRFLFATADGALRQFRIDEGSVAFGSESPMEPDLSSPPPSGGQRTPVPVTALDATPEWVVAGDALGALRRLHVPSGRAARLGADPASSSGPDEPGAAVRRVAIAPPCPGVRASALVLLASGEASLYDLESGQQVAVAKTRAADACWAAPGRPFLAGAEGALRLYDGSLSSLCAPAASRPLPYPPRGPHLLPAGAALCVRAALQHGAHPSVVFPDAGTPPAGGYPAGAWVIDALAAEHYRSLPPELFKALGRCEGTPGRCALAAGYFGDPDEARFWALAAHNLRRAAARPPSPPPLAAPRPAPATPPRPRPARPAPPSPARPPTQIGFQPSYEETGTRLLRAPDALPSFLDLYRDGPAVLASGRRRVDWYRGRTLGPDERTKLTHHAITMGRLAEGVELLQQTPADDPSYFAAALKACVVAASVSREAFEDAVKTAAVSMMARGTPRAVDEGVQLLCSVGRAQDACRYLAQANRWGEALAIARASLPPHEAASFVSTYAELLLRFQRRARATEALLSIGSFSRVLEVLVDANLVERAALFAAACAECGVLLEPERNGTPLCFLAAGDYGALLARCGVRTGAERYTRAPGPPPLARPAPPLTVV